MMEDLIKRQDAIDAFDKQTWSAIDIPICKEIRTAVKKTIEQLPSAQPKRTEERTETHACDCISRQAVIGALWKVHQNRPLDSDRWVISDCLREIDRIPYVRHKTGRWILHENQRQEDIDNGNYLYICSECGKSDIHAKTQEVPFCWWCGARMMEVEHGTDR